MLEGKKKQLALWFAYNPGRKKVIPTKQHPVWERLLKKIDDIQFNLLPTRMLMMRMKLMNRSSAPQAKNESIEILYNYFKNNESNIPEDIELLIYLSKGESMEALISVDEASKMIQAGKCMLISGDEKILSQLPKGNWIGGTIPYFMTAEGGVCNENLVYVNVINESIVGLKIMVYSKEDIETIPSQYPENGLTFVILPAFTEIHTRFAEKCSSWKGVFNKPLVGWIAGQNLSAQQSTKPKVFNGQTGEVFTDSAVATHIELESSTYAKVGIINLFKQGEGDRITFPETSFDIKTCNINGIPQNFSEYLNKEAINTELPLVASYMGEMINVSVRDSNQHDQSVRLYAPVFEGVEYRFARPIGEYETYFKSEMAKHTGKPVFSFNCVLNYFYAKLEGKKTAHFTGPMTFGEIAYMLLNQTLVYVTLEEKTKSNYL